MSRSHNTNTHHPRRLALALMAGGLVAGCGGGDKPWTIDPDGFDGIDEVSFPLLGNYCTINSTTMSLSVRRGETLYLTLRATDGMVIAGAQANAQGGECAVPVTHKIAITEDAVSPPLTVGATTEKVFLDYINGTFALGSTTGQTVTPGITISLATASSIVVRGSSGADKVYLGSTYNTANPPVLQYSWINVNGDTTADVRFTGVTDVKVSTGVGTDTISADGGQGTGTALDSTITFSAFGGPDADTLTGGKGPSTLDGGAGDDKFIQTATVGPDTIIGGPGIDTVDYSVRIANVSVTVCTTCSLDPGGCIAANTTCHINQCVADAGATKTQCISDAGGTKTQCISDAGGTKTQCISDAGATKTQCISDAGTAKTNCLATPLATKTGCLATPLATKNQCVLDAGTAQSSCVSNAGTTGCVAEAAACAAACAQGDQTCIDACNAADCVAACTFAQTTTVAGCNSAYDAYANPVTGTCMTPYNAYADPVTGSCMIPYNGQVDPTTGACFTAFNGQVDPTTGACFTAFNGQVDPTTGACFTAFNAKVTPVTGTCTTSPGTYPTCDATQVSCQGGATVPFCSVCHGDDGAANEGDTINDDVEIVLGGKGNDTLSAFWALASTGYTLKGNEGDDTLIGSPFNDTLDGGAGNDLLIGGLGNDILIGGNGIDTVSYAERTNAVKVSLNSAHLWVPNSNQNGELGENDSIASDIENLTGGAGDDFLRGNALANIIRGGAGNDTIEGGAGIDTLYGEAGNDRLYGGPGGDTLIGGPGNDTLVGGDGDDIIDATDTPAAADTIDCDGVNDSAGAAGATPGSVAAGQNDALFKDTADVGAQHCDL